MLLLGDGARLGHYRQVNPTAGAILDTPDWAIDKLLQVNIKSAIQLLREAKLHMGKVGLPSLEQPAECCRLLPSNRDNNHGNIIIIIFAPSVRHWRVLSALHSCTIPED